MNRADKRIADRIVRGGLPTAYDPWDNKDCEVANTLTTKPYDYTKTSQMVIFEYEREEQ